MKIYTLTLSPAYDVHAICEDFSVGRENLASLTSREAGGKGINISRALYSMGIKSAPVVLLGSENSDEYEAALAKSGLEPKIIRVQGRIRENLTLHSKHGETRISYRGFDAPRDLVELMKNEITPDPCDILTLTGRLPEGTSPNELLLYLTKLRDRGVRIVLDSRSYTAADVKELSPWLIKPNREEIYEYIGKRVEKPEELIPFADKIRALSANLALVTLDKNGAALITENEVIIAHAPEVNTVSSIGAGDSAIAGFIYAVKNGYGEGEALRYAIAFGSAAAMTEGTNPPRQEDINSIIKKLI